jgi:hypothetical protein
MPLTPAVRLGPSVFLLQKGLVVTDKSLGGVGMEAKVDAVEEREDGCAAGET